MRSREHAQSAVQAARAKKLFRATLNWSKPVFITGLTGQMESGPFCAVTALHVLLKHCRHVNSTLLVELFKHANKKRLEIREIL